MKSRSALAFLFSLALLALAGCQLPSESAPRSPRVYLMLVVPEGMQPQDLPARREQIVRYLLESDLLQSREDLVNDPDEADRTIRATLLEDGFKLEIFNPSTGRVIHYEPTWMPDDYYYYEGLIFYGTAGSIHRRHPRDDDDRHQPPHARAPGHRDNDDHRQPPPAQPPGHRDNDDDRQPPAGTPGHTPRPPGHDRTDDHPRTEPPKTGTPAPRTQPPAAQPRSPLPPGPSANRPKYNDDRPTRDDRPVPREHPREDHHPKKDDDKPKPAEAPPRPVQDQRPDNVPLR